ncbi:SigB/SigF/SigG family RNA polymerase sigma factor [Kineosporia sp. NBRC 101731]|uniref:SigB/SigF/SigG family RNA polymerase sigma factor n=1 Tax=Kineosporia sp. NBRC 101731 TaxID=3032199 RepID=UPI0024A3AFEE|nr:SigB/SigF/SigG family RNA polymerase sigma factor [Kineosporia sp. NBRC 101731]GLY28409.1 hypothetical protein Kisp02_17740 [Kineosporia sp. NBRC 101731]
MIQQQESTLSVLQRTPRRDGSPDAQAAEAHADPVEDGVDDVPVVAPTPEGSPEVGPAQAPASAPHRRAVAPPAESPQMVAARLRENTDDDPATLRRRGRHVRDDDEEPAPPDPDLLRLSTLSKGDPQYQQLRRIIIETHLPLVHHLAQRFKGRGEPYDDLVQVGTIGLLHAVDRFDPQRGAFAAFAVPTIVGEIRRHFRDRGWAMRIPRRIQDLGRRVSEARETLTHTHDRSPTVQEIAQYLDVDADLVIEALDTASAYITVPLPTTADESDRMGKAFEDAGLELVEQRETLRPLLARLPEREQRILELRFGKGLSQAQIAAEVGVSQMHVSRLLTKSLNILRSGLTQEF